VAQYKWFCEGSKGMSMEHSAPHLLQNPERVFHELWTLLYVYSNVFVIENVLINMGSILHSYNAMGVI